MKRQKVIIPQSNHDQFALKIYQKESNEYVLKIFWILILAQFPAGFIMSYFHLFYIRPHVFLINAIFTAIIHLVFRYFIKQNKFVLEIKYFLLSYLLIILGIIIYSYLNDVATQMLWLTPIIIASLYFDRLLFYLTIAGSIAGLIALDIISPLTYRPERFYDLVGASFLIFASLVVVLILSYNRVQHLKSGIESATKAVVSSASIINHAVKNELVKIAIGVTNINDLLVKNGIHTENYQMVMTSMDHLFTLIARIQEKIQNIHLETIEINLAEILESCLDSFTPYFKEKNIKLVKNYDNPIKLNGDPVHLREVFNNIIINSIEAIHNKEGIIEITSKSTGKNIMISLMDNGEGIPKECLSRVIDPFYSTKGNHTQNFGLGLTYCYNVMREHCGDLDIESEIDQGTTITLKFPGA